MSSRIEEVVIPQEVLIARYLSQEFKRRSPRARFDHRLLNDAAFESLKESIFSSMPLSSLSRNMFDNVVGIVHSRYLNPRAWEGFEEAKWNKNNMRQEYVAAVLGHREMVEEFDNMVDSVSGCCYGYNAGIDSERWTLEALQQFGEFKSAIDSPHPMLK